MITKIHTGTSALPSAKAVHKGIIFAGNYLNREWTRRFILGTLLQSYEPPLSDQGVKRDSEALKGVASNPNKPMSAAAVEAALLKAQKVLSNAWGIPVRPLDSISEKRIFRLLARYACGEGLLSDEALNELNAALNRIPGVLWQLDDPSNMERFLECVGYVKRGDNLRRIAYPGELHYAPQAHAMIKPYLKDSLQRDGGDPYDQIRGLSPGPAYAIDSATTSEVDDAIGIELDPDTGQEIFTVYISDATVYCPIDSQIEHLTARLLSTTTYLPENVYFMLPKPIVEAATLRKDKPCRTFNVKFQVDERTGELTKFSISLGWLQQLRRITYDQVQPLLTPDVDQGDQNLETSASLGPRAPPPWLTSSDTHALRRIYNTALVRFRARMARTAANHTASITNCLPDPLIKVDGLRVVSLTDQVVCTQDSRLAVAEMMIAANEVCSRIAQANKIPIPYRGTRLQSSEHKLALGYTEPDGVSLMPSLDPAYMYTAQLMQLTIRQLGAVTRAIYHYVPIYHAGLDTTYYTHSTSPLRRHADMLVHHQLKVWLWLESKKQKFHSSPLTSHNHSSHFHPHQFIPEYAMATLCTNISTNQEQASLLQDRTARFWTLCYVQQLLHDHRGNAGERHFVCLVGETKDVMASPEYSRFVPNASRNFAALRSREDHLEPGIEVIYDTERDLRESTSSLLRQSTPEYRYISELYLPELQLVHTLYHNSPSVLVGAVVECRVTHVQPMQGVMELEVVTVREGKDERMLETLWMSGLVSHLDS
ncbi:unnamed protein product [Phytomonas sp. Hart1]|nr:unnamed protein product [Phytomonas sp. Hart1]|eukprot:CCW66626.1 unnamed protein product [Phytomonas sp. isolate Hart1]